MSKRVMLWLFSFLLLVGASSPKPHQMRETRWVTALGDKSTVFNRPQCSLNFNATCISDGTTITSFISDPLDPAYLLTDVEFNVYGVTAGDDQARGYNIFIVRILLCTNLNDRTWVAGGGTSLPLQVDVLGQIKMG